VIAVPAIDLRQGACVQLVGGSYQAERVRWKDPMAVAERWRSTGFGHLHVVDLDRATDRGDNRAAIARLAELPEITVQVGGGLRSEEAIAEVFDWGAATVVAGTRAIEEPDWLDRVSRQWPDRIVVAADARGTKILTRGWTGSTGLEITDVLRRLEDLPLAGILVTAVHVEGRLAGPDVDLIATAVTSTRHPIQASGGITTLDDLARLEKAGVTRAIIGMALYTGRLDGERAAKEFRA
jgi:phosphoribosylformimino-5-aminoimidazole carboxamide ribotide isomerase